MKNWRKVVKIGKKYVKYYIFLRKGEVEKLEQLFGTSIKNLRFNVNFDDKKMVLSWRIGEQ